MDKAALKKNLKSSWTHKSSHQKLLVNIDLKIENYTQNYRYVR